MNDGFPIRWDNGYKTRCYSIPVFAARHVAEERVNARAFRAYRIVAPVIHVGFAKLIRKILRAHAGIAVHCSLNFSEKRDREKIRTLKKMGQPIEDVVK